MTGLLLAAGGGPLGDITARVFLAVAVIVAVARVVSRLFQRFGLPGVLGEIVAGVALGPSLLGLLPGDLPERLFPADIRPHLRVAAEVGLVIFMFVVGLEVDPDSLKRSGKRAVVLSLSSIAVPLALGALVLAPLVHDRYGQVDGRPVAFGPFALFMGVAMSGTAFAVLARILTERNMFRIPLGMLAIACAAIDDIVVFALLTVVVAIASSGSLGQLPISLGELVLFTVVLFMVVRPILDRFVMARYRAAGKLDTHVLAILLGGAMASAWVAHLAGLAAIIGAFLFGAAVPRRATPGLAHEVSERVEGVSVVVLLPVFFVATGLDVDVRGLGVSGLLPLLGVVLVACAGKFIGGGLAARLMGISGRQSLALATLMNTRGLTELVILNIGRSAGLIDGPLFTMMVIMAVGTTVAAGPLLGVIYPERLLRRDIADAERQRAQTGARQRLAIVLDEDALDDPHALDVLARTASATLGADRPAEVTLLALLAGNDMARLGAALGAVQPVRRALEGEGLAVVSTVRFAGDPRREVLAELEAAPPDFVVLRWSAGEEALEAIRAVAVADVADVVVVAGHWPAAAPRAAGSDAPVEVGADLDGQDALAVAEHAARWARALPARLVVQATGRAGRSAAEQLRRAGWGAHPEAAGGGGHAVELRGLGLAGDALDLPTVAAAAGASSPLLLVRGRQGERRPIAERVPFVADAGVVPSSGRAGGDAPDLGASPELSAS